MLIGLWRLSVTIDTSLMTNSNSHECIYETQNDVQGIFVRVWRHILLSATVSTTLSGKVLCFVFYKTFVYGLQLPMKSDDKDNTHDVHGKQHKKLHHSLFLSAFNGTKGARKDVSFGSNTK